MLSFTEANDVFCIHKKLITWTCSRCLCCVHHLIELMCFLFHLFQCHFPTLMPQPQYCTGRYALCPCLNQGHNLKTAKARGTECPFCPVTAVVRVMVTPHVLERALDSAKYKLHSSIQMLLWLPHILSSLLTPNHLPHFDNRDPNPASL